MSENKTPENGAGQPVKLDMSVKVFPTPEAGNLLARASVTLGGCFAVRGISIVDSEKGAFVSMPRRADKNGEFHDVCFPTTPEMRQALISAVMGEYQQVMQKTHDRAEQAIEKASVRAAEAQEKPPARAVQAQEKPSIRAALQAKKAQVAARPALDAAKKVDRGAR